MEPTLFYEYPYSAPVGFQNAEPTGTSFTEPVGITYAETVGIPNYPIGLGVASFIEPLAIAVVVEVSILFSNPFSWLNLCTTIPVSYL